MSNVGPIVPRLITLFLVIDPLYDWALLAQPRSLVGGIAFSDLYLLTFALVTILCWTVERFRGMRIDSYVALGLVFLAYRVATSVMHEGSDPLDFAPRLLLNVVLYLVACSVHPDRIPLFRIAIWHLVVYLAGILIEFATGSSGIERFSSIFGNPNFLAFNTLNVMMLIELSANRGRSHALAWVGSSIILLLTRTRSVVIAMAWLIWPLTRRQRFLVIVSAILVVPALLSFNVFRIDVIDELVGLNGRLAIWQNIFESLHQFDLLFGAGDAAMRRLEIMPAYDELTGQVIGFTGAQNHYLKLVIETGIVGLALWLAQVSGYLVRLRGMSRNRTNTLGVAFVAALMTIQLVENDLFSNPTVSLIMGLFVAHGRYHKLQCARAVP